MAITPDELPAYLQAIYDRVEAAAVPVAQKVGNAYKEHLVGFTLHESGEHGHATFENGVATYPEAAPAGRPPAFMDGQLADSVLQDPAYAVGPGVARTTVAPHTVYAATQQWGAVHHGRPGMALWYERDLTMSQVRQAHWLRRSVTIKEHPYMNVAVDETIANGALERAGEEAFTVTVWG